MFCQDRPVDVARTEDEQALREVEKQVLWLATSIVQAANARPGDGSGIKVGGHQASSASIVTIMTALWFDALTAADRVSVKPHASPVLHAINSLLGRLDADYLPRLREFGGLQPYPSRTKDPDTPDYSTGSVGIGATAPVWGAIARRYVSTHFDTRPGGRQISLLGDAELDEGAIWECVADPVVQRLGEVLWVVDVNRQSLDRIVPEIAVQRWAGMFAAAGWQVIEVKYGRRLQALFARDGGSLLRARIDSMDNEEYQWLLRAPFEDLRARLVRDDADLGAFLAPVDDVDLAVAVRDLGGHDLVELSRAFGAVDNDRPTVVLAYTIKGCGLPIEGHPNNHSALLTDEQYAEFAHSLARRVDQPWTPLDPDSPAGKLCARTAARLERSPVEPTPPPPVPTTLGRSLRGRHSTQAALGRVLTDLTREAPEVARRVVTVSPDVASSTNTGGWINKVGVWSPQDRHDWFASGDGADDRLVRWRETSTGQHVELGIAEVNLVSLLGELGATWSTLGQPLLPIGTVYDPFVGRALEPWVFGTYAGGQSVLVGTPSGVTLAPEGGAHQSITTPSIGLETPGVTAYEPAFAVEVEWCLLDALSRLGRPDGESAYLRLSTRPLDQALAALPEDDAGREARRRDVLAGGYRLRTADGDADVTIAVVGALVPEAVEAADRLTALGLAADVVVVTSYDRLWRAAQSRRGLLRGPVHGVDETVLDRLFRPVPLVTLLDGHPHTLAFLGTVTGTPVSCLGVARFGQAGSLPDVYRHHGLDAESVVGAALDLLDA
ncbi:MAG TPA: pyruvate dehydrogenase [Mycobacteriales bacterium]|nr:pyruvate dehydrogenase [Mycobacteriales bacterium]